MGYARLEGGRTSIIQDAGRLPNLFQSNLAHASVLGFELTHGRQPLIVNCGSGANFGRDWWKAGRATQSHSTFFIKGQSSAKLTRSLSYNSKLTDFLSQGPTEVVTNKSKVTGGTEFTVSHDAYASKFNVNLERKLEYQLSRSISAVTRKAKRRIGLLEGTEMSLGGSPGGMGGPGRPPSVIYRSLAREFEMVSIPFDVGPMKPGDTEHPFADLDLLLIVHPVKINRPQSPQPGMPPMGNTTLELISKDTQYAIDQYLVNGGKAVAFLDNQHFVSRFFDIYSAQLPFTPQDRHPQWYKDLYNLFEL